MKPEIKLRELDIGYYLLEILSEEPIAQNLEIGGVKCFFKRYYTDFDILPDYVSEFVVRSLATRVNENDNI